MNVLRDVHLCAGDELPAGLGRRGVVRGQLPSPFELGILHWSLFECGLRVGGVIPSLAFSPLAAASVPRQKTPCRSASHATALATPFFRAQSSWKVMNGCVLRETFLPR